MVETYCGGAQRDRESEHERERDRAIRRERDRQREREPERDPEPPRQPSPVPESRTPPAYPSYQDLADQVVSLQHALASRASQVLPEPVPMKGSVTPLMEMNTERVRREKLRTAKRLDRAERGHAREREVDFPRDQSSSPRGRSSSRAAQRPPLSPFKSQAWKRLVNPRHRSASPSSPSGHRHFVVLDLSHPLISEGRRRPRTTVISGAL